MKSRLVDLDVSWLAFDGSAHFELATAIELSNASFAIIVSTECGFEEGWLRRAWKEINMGRQLVFSDHDHQFNGDRNEPFFKPDFSKELVPEPSYLPVVAVEKHFAAGIVRSHSVDSVSETIKAIAMEAEHIAHIPDVLVHLGSRVAREPSRETNDYSSVSPGKISIIIPTLDHLDLLIACVDSIRRTIREGSYEIIVVDNNSIEPRTINWFDQQRTSPDIQIVAAPFPFNWSRLNNIGRTVASGEILVFMNNDVEAISERWNQRFAEILAAEGVGAVGPLLLYEDGTIQHAGVIIGFGGFADHIYSGSSIEAASESCFVSPCVTRNVSAVTGACFAIRSSLFDEMGAFDEEYEVAGDVDLCLRLLERGYRNVYEGRIRMYHYESKTRRSGLPNQDRRKLRMRIESTLPQGDPYYNPNLSLAGRFPMPDLYSR